MNMKRNQKILLFCSVALLLITIFSFTYLSKQNPYSQDKLISPAELAKILVNPKTRQPVIFNVGSMPLIKGAQSGGMGYSDDSMKEFKEKLLKVDKNEAVIIYCGCCKMENCPNVKLPFQYLESNGFKNAKILNIETGLHEDWIDKGYPMK
jgi:rhodanese-related sulfurtransferase